MRANFSVTFERVTPESAEHGEAESSGFIDEGLRLRDALKLCSGAAGGCEASDSNVSGARWLTFYKTNDCTRDAFETGAEESRSLHFPESLTSATRKRIARLCGIRC